MSHKGEIRIQALPDSFIAQRRPGEVVHKVTVEVVLAVGGNWIPYVTIQTQFDVRESEVRDLEAHPTATDAIVAAGKAIKSLVNRVGKATKA